jgi:hypothetical protein
MLKTSDGKWQRKQYMEVEIRDSNPSYNRKNVRGSTSGATAFITDAVKVYTGTSVSDVFYLTDIYPGPSGSSFIIGEYLLFEGLNIKNATKVIGSAVSATNIESAEDFDGGDILSSNNTTGEGLRFEVSTIKDATQAQGYLNFKIVDGGYGYAVNSAVTILPGANTKGSGASFAVKEISNTTNFRYNTNWLADGYVNIALNATSYGPNLFNSSLSSVIDNALSYANLTVGSIASLTAVTSGTHNYDGNVNPRVFERRVYGYGFMRSDGSVWGNNAIISGKLAAGNGIIGSVRLLSSGFGYNDSEELLFTNEANSQLTSTMTIQLGAIGSEEGTWTDTSGFLNSDKYITDSNYYQDFSYEIQLEKSLDKYFNVLKQVMHPVGNRVFGKPVIIDTNQLNLDIVVDSITVT